LSLNLLFLPRKHYLEDDAENEPKFLGKGKSYRLKEVEEDQLKDFFMNNDIIGRNEIIDVRFLVFLCLFIFFFNFLFQNVIEQ